MSGPTQEDKQRPSAFQQWDTLGFFQQNAGTSKLSKPIVVQRQTIKQ